jgi:UDP-glucose 4-epimerase
MSLGLTGAKGMIGGHLIRYFEPRIPGPIRAIVRSLSASDARKMREVEIMYGDLSSFHDCAAFASGLRTIVYLAHTNTPITSDSDFPSDAALNLIPLLTLIQAIKGSGGCPHLIYFSSGGAVYGPNPGRVPFREGDSCQPISSYGVQKFAAEHYLRIAALRGILTATVLRVGNAYGTLLPSQRLQGLIGVAVNNLLQGKPLRIFGNPDNVRDYVHLDDVARVCELAMCPRQTFAVYNVGSGVGHSVREVLHIVAESFGTELPDEEPSTLEGAACLVDWVVLDIDKAKREMDWVPAIDLRTGVSRLIQATRAAR